VKNVLCPRQVYKLRYISPEQKFSVSLHLLAKCIHIFQKIFLKKVIVKEFICMVIFVEIMIPSI